MVRIFPPPHRCVLRECCRAEMSTTLVTQSTPRQTGTGMHMFESAGSQATPGQRIVQGDVVKLKGTPVEWERLTLHASTPAPPPASPLTLPHARVNPTAVQQQQPFVYMRYWKPVGVVTTTDRRVKDNVLDAIGARTLQSFTTDRVFPIGRLVCVHG